jgi:hypothetical protein
MLTIGMGSNGRCTPNQENASTIPEHLPPSDFAKSKCTVDALRDLYNLLEEYGPSWYTEKHHDKASSALLSVKNY